ncbi:S8 family peptidase [Nonomuraea zeae]|nr:S8 family serine peptidase [Nonomuraea zeae]
MHSRLLAALSGVAMTLAAATVPGHATEPGQETASTTGVVSRPRTDPAPAGAKVAKELTITLITGDVVTYAPAENGPPSISIQPTPRPDGMPITFATLPGADGGWLVLPSDAVEMVTGGKLDEKLFDVETLAKERRVDAIPLIVSYAGSPKPSALKNAAGALPAGENVRILHSVGGAALTVQPAQAARFWGALRDSVQQSGQAAGEIAKVWLDRRVEASLDQSVPLIGAPAGWERGLDGTGIKVAVLDTGIDGDHPDLASKIVASANFSTSPDLADRQGHGTHVASTIAGSGSASDGRYKGVAPGASLLVGKVLADDGNGDWSWAIAGMEWAAEQGADVVNMSLGSCCGDGSDPMSQALNELTKKHGTLFVAAAGNAHDPLTVSVPAAADQALAVGAVDKVNGKTLAGFSSKGPRLDDAAVKPNIVAPGVDIVAARSAASFVAPAPGNDRYTANSGTSMATPHVAGAAAILAQQHPDWDADELRDALTSTAERNDGHNWFEQGSGLVNVRRALSQQVFATSVVDFGLLSEASTTRRVTYRNTGQESVTLALEPVTRGWSGKPAPDKAVRLNARGVTVPGHGTVTVDLTVDPTRGPTGAYGGWVSASSGDIQLVTPFSYYTGPAQHRLGISLLNAYGTKEFVPGREGTEPRIYMIPLKRENSPEDPFNPYGYYAVRTDFFGNAEVRLPAGEYEVIGVAHENLVSNRQSWVIEHVKLDADKTVTLDARKTVPTNPVTQKDLRGSGNSWYVRTFPDRQYPVSVYGGTVGQDFYVTPVSKASAGEVRLSQAWSLKPAPLASAMAGAIRLDPVYDVEAMRTNMTEAKTYPVVSVGQGRSEDFDGVDVAGKLALAGVPLPAGDFPYVDASRRMDQAAQTARQRGAAAFIGYLDIPAGRARVPAGASAGFHALGVTADKGRELRAALARRPLSVRMEPYTGPEAVYHLRYDHRGRVPAKPVNVEAGSLVKIAASYHADRPDTSGWEFGESATGEEPGRITYGQELRLPATRNEYFGPVDDRVAWNRKITSESLTLESSRRFSGHDRSLREHWFKAPLVPGASDVPDRRAGMPCVMCRDGDRFVPAEQWLDSDPHHLSGLSPLESSPRLFGGSREFPVQGRYPRSFIVPGGDLDYRLESVDISGRTLSPEVSTSSRFHSTQTPNTSSGHVCAFGTSCQVQPAIRLTYELPLDLLNRAKAQRPFALEVRAGAHSSIRQAPEVKRLKVEYSADDGSTWQQAHVSMNGKGRFAVKLLHPALKESTGFISLRVTASDTAGGSVTQTVKRAYTLS